MTTVTETTPQGRQRPPLWRDVRALRVGGQVLFVVALIGLATWLYLNLMANLAAIGQGTSFSFLETSAGFEIAGSDFRPTQTMWEAILVGISNTVRVAAVGIVLASIVGFVVGVGRLSSNWLVRKATTVYVETFRNVPVLIIIMFCYFAVFLELPPPSEAMSWTGVLEISVRGVVVPWVQVEGSPTLFLLVAAFGVAVAVLVGWWRTKRAYETGRPSHRMLWGFGVLVLALVIGQFVGGQPWQLSVPEAGGTAGSGGMRLTPEFAALLLGLTLYTASHIAEIVRASVLAVPRGQQEAADALALSPSQRMRLVILPQALRIMIPPLANQYLNLLKNSSLAVAIAFPEMSRVVKILIGQRAPAPQSTLVMMGVYLSFSLLIALVTNLVNKRLAMKGGRK